MIDFKSEKYNLVLLGIALVFIGFLLVFVKPMRSSEKSDTFAQEPIEVKGFSQDQINEDSLPKRIIIPALNLNLEVKKARIVNGYWEVFPDAAGWGEGSGIPGFPGNQVIFAHAREGLFLPLKQISEGVPIYIFNSNMWFSYEVKEIKEVLPNQVEVIEPTEDETLTLYTCSGFDDSKRLIVVAKRN